MKKKKDKGFTLLEILLVLVAIGILVAIIILAINPNRQISQVRDLVRKTDINTLQKALEQYLIDNGRYPNSISTNPGYICNTGTEQVGGSINCTGNIDLRELVPTYIAGIPKDPQITGKSTGYTVAINPANNKVSIQASLSENSVLVINSLSIVKNNLIMYLDAGDTLSYPKTGSSFIDLSGNSNNGQLINGVGYNITNGGSLAFDGINDYVDSGNSSSLNILNQITISVWIYFLSPPSIGVFGNPSIVDKWDWPNNKRSYVLGTDGGNVAAYVSYDGTYDNRLICFDSPPSLNVWTNLTMTYDNQVLRLYRNSLLVSSASYNQARNLYDNLSTNVFLMRSRGNEGSTRFLNARLSQVLIYNRALSSEEIQQNFNISKGRFGL